MSLLSRLFCLFSVCFLLSAADSQSSRISLEKKVTPPTGEASAQASAGLQGGFRSGLRTSLRLTPSWSICRCFSGSFQPEQLGPLKPTGAAHLQCECNQTLQRTSGLHGDWSCSSQTMIHSLNCPEHIFIFIPKRSSVNPAKSDSGFITKCCSGRTRLGIFALLDEPRWRQTR